MIIFIKKIKTKEGINSFDNEKIKNGIPKGYQATVEAPIITLTANHVMIAYKCEVVAKPEVKEKKKVKSKKTQ
jgi:hypothetical protein